MFYTPLLCPHQHNEHVFHQNLVSLATRLDSSHFPVLAVFLVWPLICAYRSLDKNEVHELPKVCTLVKLLFHATKCSQNWLSMYFNE